MAKGIQEKWHILLLLVALVALIASAALVGLGVLNPGEKRNLEATVKQGQPDLDLKAFVEVPPRPLKVQTNAAVRVLKSQERYGCVHEDCGKPVVPGEGAYNCPFCGRAQPDVNERDDDQDGMVKGVELAAGLDDSDPEDALIDSDGDLFVNLDEYWQGEQKAGGDPSGRTLYKMNDASSHPPYGDYLVITAAQMKRKRFQFKSISNIGGNKFNIGIQVADVDRTFFKKIGEEVNGYKLIEYEGPDAKLVAGKPAEIKRFDPNNRQKKVLKIEELATGRILDLEMNKPFVDNNIRVQLTCLKDPSISKLLKVDDELTVRDEVYVVTEINRSGTAKLKLKGKGTEFVARVATQEQRVELAQRKDGSYVEPDPRTGVVGDFGPGEGGYTEEEIGGVGVRAPGPRQFTPAELQRIREQQIREQRLREQRALESRRPVGRPPNR